MKSAAPPLHHKESQNVAAKQCFLPLQSLQQAHDGNAVCLFLRLHFLRRYVSTRHWCSALFHCSELLHDAHFRSLLQIECTYEHFGSNETCPSCNKKLGQNDFLELVISEPTAASQQTTKTMFQNLFTKITPGTEAVICRDNVSRGLRVLDDGRRAMRFLFNQFLRETNTLRRDLAEANSKVGQMATQIQLLQSKLNERDSEVARLRHIAASASPLPPSSSHSASSGGGRRGRYTPVIEIASARGSIPPPLQGFMQSHNSRGKENIIYVPGKEHSHSAMIPARRTTQAPTIGVTPIQTQRPLSSISVNHSMHRQSQRTVGPAISVAPPQTLNAHAFSSSSGYRFSSGIGNHGQAPALQGSRSMSFPGSQQGGVFGRR